MGNHFFMYVNFSEVDDKQDYHYWFSIMAYYLKYADSIDFHIWNEEVKVIQELEAKTELQKTDLAPLQLTSFKGAINPTLIRFILKESFNSVGEIKWFSIFLKRNGMQIFETGHWGSELIARNPDAKEIERMKSVLPVNATFHHFA